MITHYYTSTLLTPSLYQYTFTHKRYHLVLSCGPLVVVSLKYRAYTMCMFVWGHFVSLLTFLLLRRDNVIIMLGEEILASNTVTMKCN